VCVEARWSGQPLACGDLFDADVSPGADSRYMLKVNEYADSAEGRLKGTCSACLVKRVKFVSLRF
jgi:hypothetical protein